jgi:hypothetical protein
MSDELSGGGALHVFANGGGSPLIRSSEYIANSLCMIGDLRLSARTASELRI